MGRSILVMCLVAACSKSHDSAPAPAPPAAAQAFGPDGKEGTADDLKSWE
jgi:hypothetical protein